MPNFMLNAIPFMRVLLSTYRTTDTVQLSATLFSLRVVEIVGNTISMITSCVLIHERKASKVKDVFNTQVLSKSYIYLNTTS